MDTNLFTSKTLDNAASIFVDPHIGRAHGTSIGWPSNSYNSGEHFFQRKRFVPLIPHLFVRLCFHSGFPSVSLTYNSQVRCGIGYGTVRTCKRSSKTKKKKKVTHREQVFQAKSQETVQQQRLSTTTRKFGHFFKQQTVVARKYPCCPRYWSHSDFFLFPFFVLLVFSFIPSCLQVQ